MALLMPYCLGTCYSLSTDRVFICLFIHWFVFIVLYFLLNYNISIGGTNFHPSKSN
jgi:hypothetical protein